MDQRARLTMPDVLWVMASLAFLGVLYPVFWTSLEANLSELGTGETYLIQLILPLAVLVLYSVIYKKTIGGSAGR